MELELVQGPTVALPSTDQPSWLIGRGLDCQLVLPDPGISRHHARIDWLAEPCLVDLNSTIGTRVNGRLVDRPTTLLPGDLLAIGPWVFQLRADADRIDIADTRVALAAPRLERLLAFCLHAGNLDSEIELGLALVETARQVSGFSRALLIGMETQPPAVLASSPAGDHGFSRALVDQARGERVVRLRRFEGYDASESMIQLGMSSALAAAIEVEEERVACLYLDSRHGEQTEQADIGRICQALATIAAMTLTRLRHQQRLWQQRERIYSDLHDDLGARLLAQIYQAPTPVWAENARLMLKDLRDVVSQPSQDVRSLGQVLAEVRTEARERLAIQGVGLDWQLDVDGFDQALAKEQASSLSRLFREALTNALRHSRPQTVAFRGEIDIDRLLLKLTHDGCTRAPAQWRAGRGMASMRQRAARLGASLDWTLETDRLSLLLTLPWPPSKAY